MQGGSEAMSSVKLGPLHAQTKQLRFACCVDAVQGENVLGEIDADEQTRAMDFPFERVDESSHFPSWHSDAGRRSPLAQDGEVPSIR